MSGSETTGTVLAGGVFGGVPAAARTGERLFSAWRSDRSQHPGKGLTVMVDMALVTPAWYGSILRKYAALAGMNPTPFPDQRIDGSIEEEGSQEDNPPRPCHFGATG